MIKRLRSRWVRGTTVFVGCLLLGLFALSWFVGGSLVSPAHQSLAKPEFLPVDSLTFPSESGATIAAWHCRAAKSRGVVVLVHGIRSNRLAMLDRAVALRQRGFSSLMIDLQAHGESTGDQITIGHREQRDVSAAVAVARDLHPGEPIGLIGVSLGGAATLLAQPLPLDALVIESVFSDLRVAVRNRVRARIGALHCLATPLLLAQLPLRLGFAAHEVRPIDGISKCGCPILVAGGSEDAHTPVDETREMFDAALAPKQLWIAEGVGHRDLYKMKPREYESVVFDFLEHQLTR
ncbi:MAG: alpha/beta fold hydrolase [Planctomycetota bacterium]